MNIFWRLLERSLDGKFIDAEHHTNSFEYNIYCRDFFQINFFLYESLSRWCSSHHFSVEKTRSISHFHTGNFRNSHENEQTKVFRKWFRTTKIPKKKYDFAKTKFRKSRKTLAFLFFTSHPSQKNKNSIKKKQTLFSLPVLSFIVFFCVNYQQNKSWAG